jgi:predicted Zn-dependent protease
MISPDLANEEVNMAYYARGAINNNWDAVTDANQPNFVETTVVQYAEVGITMSSTMDNDIFGTTTPDWGSVWTPCDATRCYASRAYYTSASVRYNHNVIWNVSGVYQKQSDGRWKADARCALLHEHGHVEGLSHSATTASVMYLYCNISQHESLQTDDKDGLRAVYRSSL